MIETERAASAPALLEEIQKAWPELISRVRQLEAERAALEGENKALRGLLERVIEHRQRSHSELVLQLTNLVSKLPINDVGIIVSKLVEHNANVTHYLAGLAKGTVEANLPQPAVLKTLDQTRRDLAAAIRPIVEELVTLETPIEPDLLQSLGNHPDRFFSPQMVRANRCFIKGQMPRERILREFGEQALPFFNDVTTDVKLNPRPKPEEIALGFKSDFESLLKQSANLSPEKIQKLRLLHERVQKSKAPTEQARAQRNAFLRLSFLVELLNYYEHENTQPADVVFAQRLPALVEQLVPPGANDSLEEKLILGVEVLMAYVISPDHRHMIVNNIGKSGGGTRTLKFVLKLRSEKGPEMDQVAADFVRHLIPAPPGKPPSIETLVAVFRLLGPEMQKLVVRSIFHCDRMRKDEAQALGKALATKLELTGVGQDRPELNLPPEMERQQTWAKIKDLIASRRDPGEIAAVIRDRLNAKYDVEEIRQSWLALIEADSMSFIRIFCHLPYLANGKTDAIARTVMETYVSRLTHEKYAGTHTKIVNSLRSMYKAKPDSPTLLTFLALVKWVSPEAASTLSAQAGIPPAA